ncbi:MAG TPA: hypothetical protein VLM79_27505 [Kofleriaceae bacterium]|nr:hypothetical protein [Kofleriaceae bacterium]
MPVIVFRPSLVLCALAALAPACHSDRATPGDAPPGGGDAVDGVQCGGASGVFPTFDKTCSIADDCAIGIHQTNCCGATVAIGLAKAELVRFDADEKVCVDQYPPCACPATPTAAEDGHTPVAGQSIIVDCVSRRCMTSVR